MKDVKIVIGEAEYKIDRLPIGVLRELDSEFVDTPVETLSRREKEQFFFDQSINIIAIAIRKNNPEMTAAKLLEVPSNMQEIFSARDVILRHAGLVISKEKPSGEASAAASLNGGASSTAESAPSADTLPAKSTN